MTSIWASRNRVSIRHVRNQRDLARALDRRLQLPLMHRAGARDAPRENLAALGHERPDQLHVLVVDVVDLVRAELADLATTEERAALSLFLVSRLLVAAAAAATAARASLSEWHRYTSTPSNRSSSISSASLCWRPSPGCRWGGRPRFTRRRSDSVRRLVCVRSTTFFSSSTRTIMWRITWSITLSRRSSSFISSPD